VISSSHHNLWKISRGGSENIAPIALSLARANQPILRNRAILARPSRSEARVAQVDAYPCDALASQTVIPTTPSLARAEGHKGQMPSPIPHLSAGRTPSRRSARSLSQPGRAMIRQARTHARSLAKPVGRQAGRTLIRQAGPTLARQDAKTVAHARRRSVNPPRRSDAKRVRRSDVKPPKLTMTSIPIRPMGRQSMAKAWSG